MDGREEGSRAVRRLLASFLAVFFKEFLHIVRQSPDGFAWGYDGPVGSGDNTYRVTFTVTKKGDELHYGIDYHLLTDPK